MESKNLFNFVIFFILFYLPYVLVVVESQPPTNLYSITIDPKTSYWNVVVYDYEQAMPVNQFTWSNGKYKSLIGILDYNVTTSLFTLMYLNDQNIQNTIGTFDITTKQLVRVKSLPLQSNCFIDTIPMGYDQMNDMIITSVTNLENNTVTLMQWDFNEKQETPISFDDQYNFDNVSFPTGTYNLNQSTYYTHFIDQDTQLHNILTYNTSSRTYVDYVFNDWDVTSSSLSSPVFLISPPTNNQLYGITQVDQQLTLLQINLGGVSSGSSNIVKSLVQIDNPYPLSSIPYVLSSSDPNYLILFTSTNNHTTTLTTVNLSNLQYKSIPTNNNFPSSTWFVYAF